MPQLKPSKNLNKAKTKPGSSKLRSKSATRTSKRGGSALEIPPKQPTPTVAHQRVVVLVKVVLVIRITTYYYVLLRTTTYYYVFRRTPTYSYVLLRIITYYYVLLLRTTAYYYVLLRSTQKASKSFIFGGVSKE